MAKESRGYQNGRTGRKLNYQAQVPQYEVAASPEIEKTQGSDATPAPGQVHSVTVRDGACLWPKVNGHAGPDGVREVLVQSGVMVEEFLKLDSVMFVYFRCVVLE